MPLAYKTNNNLKIINWMFVRILFEQVVFNYVIQYHMQVAYGFQVSIIDL